MRSQSFFSMATNFHRNPTRNGNIINKKRMMVSKNGCFLLTKTSGGRILSNRFEWNFGNSVLVTIETNSVDWNFEIRKKKIFRYTLIYTTDLQLLDQQLDNNHYVFIGITKKDRNYWSFNFRRWRRCGIVFQLIFYMSLFLFGKLLLLCYWTNLFKLFFLHIIDTSAIQLHFWFAEPRRLPSWDDVHLWSWRIDQFSFRSLSLLYWI